jgi:hypothetical protein
LKLLKKYIFSFLLLLAVEQANAQIVKKELSKIKDALSKEELLDYDSNYIQKYGSNIVSFAPLISAPTFSTAYAPKKSGFENKYNIYRPYLRDIIGFTFSYRAITFSAKVKGSISPEDENLYGKTKYNLYRLRLYTNAFIFDFFHNTFNGLSDRNTEAYNTSLPNNTPFIIRPDLRTRYTKLKVLYIFSHKKFSYRAAFRFTERQKKSKTSFYISSHAYRLSNWGDSSFFNSGQENAFGSMQNLSNLRVFSMGVGPGFIANIVWRKWFLSFRAEVLGNMLHHNAKNPKDALLSKGWRGGIMGDIAVSFGYNGDKFYATFISSVDRNIINLPHINATTSFFNNELSIGMRFTAPKIFSTIYDNTPLKYFKSH